MDYKCVIAGVCVLKCAMRRCCRKGKWLIIIMAYLSWPTAVGAWLNYYFGTTVVRQHILREYFAKAPIIRTSWAVAFITRRGRYAQQQAQPSLSCYMEMIASLDGFLTCSHCWCLKSTCIEKTTKQSLFSATISKIVGRLMQVVFLTVCRFVMFEAVCVLNLNRCGFWGVFWGGWCGPAVVWGVTDKAAAAMMSSTLEGWVGCWRSASVRGKRVNTFNKHWHKAIDARH